MRLKLDAFLLTARNLILKIAKPLAIITENYHMEKLSTCLFWKQKNHCNVFKYQKKPLHTFLGNFPPIGVRTALLPLMKEGDAHVLRKLEGLISDKDVNRA